MIIRAIKTEKIAPFEKNIYEILDKYISDLPDGSILAITSKIVAICEGNVVKVGTIDKRKLATQEADAYLVEENKYNFFITIKNGILLPTAGIDESNIKDYYALWPKNPQRSANQIYDYLVKRFGNRRIGVIITDSKTTPLRYGTTGVAIAHCGFAALKDYIGKPDIYGRNLKVTKSNILDSLAVSAVLLMGEGNEQTPLALIENLPFIRFQKRHPRKKELKDLRIELEDDLYASLLTSVEWRKSN